MRRAVPTTIRTVSVMREEASPFFIAVVSGSLGVAEGMQLCGLFSVHYGGRQTDTRRGGETEQRKEGKKRIEGRKKGRKGADAIPLAAPSRPSRTICLQPPPPPPPPTLGSPFDRKGKMRSKQGNARSKQRVQQSRRLLPKTGPTAGRKKD